VLLCENDIRPEELKGCATFGSGPMGGKDPVYHLSQYVSGSLRSFFSAAEELLKFARLAEFYVHRAGGFHSTDRSLVRPGLVLVRLRMKVPRLLEVLYRARRPS